MNYDSKTDTLLHIKRVAQLLTEAAAELIRRANCHDDSKLGKAAGERSSNGNIQESIEIGKKRFGLSDQLVDILTNTANRHFK